MYTIRQRFFAFAAVIAVVTLGMSPVASGKPTEKPPDKGGVYEVTGESLPLGEGSVETWYRYHVLGEDSRPEAIGLTFTDGYLDGWPSEASDGQYDIYDGDVRVWACCGHEVKPAFPDEVLAQTAFEHVVLNVNPIGHPPPMVYTLPHIDMHFYTITDAQRLAITTPADASQMCRVGRVGVPLTCEMFGRARMELPLDQQPPAHTDLGAVEPAMGNHLIDLSSPEFVGGVFSNTYIFGAFDGDLIFFEPMLTADYLAGVEGTDCRAIPMPAAFPEAGWYPTRYCASSAGGEMNVVLDKFAWFPESSG